MINAVCRLFGEVVISNFGYRNACVMAVDL